MKILVAAHGTRGDVQPSIAIAHARRDSLHQVRLCAPKTFARWATALDFHPIDVDPAAAIGHKDARERLQHSSHLGFIAWMEKLDAQDNVAEEGSAARASIAPATHAASPRQSAFGRHTPRRSQYTNVSDAAVQAIVVPHVDPCMSPSLLRGTDSI